MATSNFLCGVIEGFYGDPWAFDQRHDLFTKLKTYGLNSYVYAPKDDLKHREIWRTPYTDEEIAELKNLISDANQHSINFTYALSPGKDIEWNDTIEVDLIVEKLNTLKEIGCSSFAILFDDIDKDDADRERISKMVMEQVNVVNQVYERMGKPLFMFCPTEYSDTKAVPNLEGSTYLKELGEKLDKEIHILWTGTTVVPQQITVDHIRQVSNVLRRKPLIWDNYFANDYDFGFNRILYLGPFDGRPLELKNEISGMLINPNCQYECNFVPIFTLGEWNRCAVNEWYDPRQSYERGLTLWLEDFPREVELNDLRLLADLFYLPFLYGNTGKEMLKDVRWMIENSRELYNEWNTKYFNLQTWFEQMSKVYRLLYKAPNKHLAKELYPYVQEAQGMLAVVAAVLDSIKSTPSGYNLYDLNYDGSSILKERGWLKSRSFKDILPDLLYELQKLVITSKNIAEFFSLEGILKAQESQPILSEPSCYAYRVWTKFSHNYATILYKKFASKQEQELCSNIWPKNPAVFYFDKHFGPFILSNQPNNIFICEKFITFEDKELKQLFAVAYFIEDVKSLRQQYVPSIIAKYQCLTEKEGLNLEAIKEEVESWPINHLSEELLEKYPSMLVLHGPMVFEHENAFRRLVQCAVATLGFKKSPRFFTFVPEDQQEAVKLLWNFEFTRIEEYKIPNFLILGGLL